MSKSNRFSSEVRERAVRMLQDHRCEYPSTWAAIESIALKIDCAPQTLHEWVRKHEVDSGVRGGTTSAEHDRIKELRRANEILKVASAFFAQAELDRRLKPLSDSSTSTATPSVSSQFARFCKLPRLATGDTPPCNATHNFAVQEPSAMMN